MTVYICNVGSSLEAVVSSFWSLIDNYGLNIEKVVFVCSEDTSIFCNMLFKVFKLICPSITDYNLIIVDEANVHESSCKIADYLKCNFSDSKFIFDVTPGRKTMSISLFRVGLKFNCPVIYLHLRSSLFRGFIYPLIPKPLCKLEVIHGKLKKGRKVYNNSDGDSSDILRIPFRYLIPILNRLYDLGGSRFTIAVPYVNLKLFSFCYDNLNDINIEFEDYQVRMINKFLDKFTIEYVYDSLLISGLIPPLNIDEVISKIRNLIENRSRNLILNPEQIVLALDTNILYLKIITNHFIDKMDIPPIIISSIVRNEINRWIDMRLRLDEVDKYIKYCRKINYPIDRARKLFYKLFSEDCRKAIIALLELIELEKYNLINYTNDNSVGDINLINSYSKLKDKFNIILLTCDRGILNRALISKISAIYVEQKRSEKLKLNLKYSNIAKALYILALYYGLIKVYSGIFSFEIQGLWSNWKISNLNNGLIEIPIDINNPVLKGLNSEIKIISIVENTLKKD